MRRHSTAAALLLLALAAPVAARAAPPASSAAADANAECGRAGETPFDDVVHRIDPTDDGGVGLVFREHAAVYFLSRDDRCFATWHQLATESAERGTRLRVSFEVAGQRVTSLARAEAAPEPAPAGTICIAPFAAEEGPGGPRMSRTPAPARSSVFEFRIDGKLRAKVGEGETARISGLPTTGRTQIGIRLDGHPSETLTLDLSKAPDRRICLWLYPGYWHWIDNGWSDELGCRCTAEWPAELELAAAGE